MEASCYHAIKNKLLFTEDGVKMKVIEVADRTPLLIKQLLEVWESSVRATHLFPIGFMGIAEQHLEMLFVADEERGKGAGKALLQYGIEQYSVHDLAVNEQNPLAKGFYEHMGFTVYKRTERDEQGNPYPLLYMKRGVERRNFP